MHSLVQWFITHAVPAFGRTLVHSLWQALAAAVLAGVLIAATRRLTAAIRYNGLVLIYALLIISVAVTFFLELGSPSVVTPNSPALTEVRPAMVMLEDGPANGVAEQSLNNGILSLVDRNAALLAGLWALLFAAQLTRTAFGLHAVQRMRKRGTQAAAGEWSEWLNNMSNRLGIRRTVLLLQSENVKVPVTVGFLKPVVLVPIGLMAHLTPQQVEAVLSHELAHIRRNDYLINLMQSFADAVFFFNPAVRWLSARIREERETCCDNIALQHTGNKKEYVEALVSFSQLPFLSSYAMAIGGTKTHLLNRVKTIVTRENSRLTAKEQSILTIGAIALVTVGIFAFKPKEKEAKKEAVVKKELLASAKNQASLPQPEVVKKSIVPLASQPIADTVPPPQKNTKPIKWKNLTTNITDDGEGKTTQVIATGEDGTVYRIRKINDEVVLLTVNDREIAKDAYPQYYSLIDAIEQTKKQRAADAEKKMQQQTLRLKEQQMLLQQKQERMLQKQEALQKNLASLALKRQVYLADSLNKRNHQNLFEQKENAFHQQSNLFQQKKQALALHKNSLNANPTLSAIIADLLANKMAESETSLSFNLTAAEMVVNGKPVDKDIFEVFRKRYIKSPGDSFSYFREGGTTRTTIVTQ